ncbi:uncharacterized protein LOC142333652 isoform X2 [Lycorma delicatula]|uniref:uncharacterized protein LOC142333652 isoform X2 n=1 Tax=Lycorma delicatula TaxID=130591 RepID=UPI003F5180F2
MQVNKELEDICEAKLEADISVQTALVDSAAVEVRFQILDGSTLQDIPARYSIPSLKPYEMPVVGVFIDPRVVTGFRYRVRPIDQKTRYLFKKKALELQSIGRGYSRRLTFKADDGTLNENDNYFWSDSFPSGFAFELEVIGPGEKFTILDANHVPVGTLEVLNCQAPQEEVGQITKNNGFVEKTVRVHLLCKIEFYDENGPTLVVPVHGLAVCRCAKSGAAGEIIKVVSVSLGSHSRRGFTLTPGISSHQRSIVVKGTSIGDIPTMYTVVGLETYELPVIGTYVDPRIMPGFTYRVRPLGLKRRHLFNGKALCLVSIGAGYGKRLTFQPLPNSLNYNDNFFWSDSYADGLGFEPRAVAAGDKFIITANGLQLGEASVFRADATQYQEHEEIEKDEKNSIIIKKYIHIDVKCHITLGNSDDIHNMRVSGTALLEKTPKQTTASLLRIDNIGLDSQLNLLFVTQHAHLVFYPV